MNNAFQNLSLGIQSIHIQYTLPVSILNLNLGRSRKFRDLDATDKNMHVVRGASISKHIILISTNMYK